MFECLEKGSHGKSVVPEPELLDDSDNDNSNSEGICTTLYTSCTTGCMENVHYVLLQLLMEHVVPMCTIDPIISIICIVLFTDNF